MNSKTIKTIDFLVEIIREKFKIEVPITNIENVVNKLGGRVVETESYNELIDGAIEKCDDGSFIIRVSPSQVESRKKFTIAHELGHLFLHMGYCTNENLWNDMSTEKFYRFGRSELEYQANEFAAALLMPKDEFMDLIQKYTDGNTVDMSIIANVFKVSLSAAINRGKFLGCLKW